MVARIERCDRAGCHPAIRPHEQRYWLDLAQDQILLAQLNEICAYGAPKSTPPLPIMLDCWHLITKAADVYLDSLTTEGLLAGISDRSRPEGQSVGSALRRITYHYWYHIGEVQAIRQMLEHVNLPQYVGHIEAEAPYRPE